MLGQEFQARLAALMPAFAEHAPRTDRDFRLDDVPAVAERIGLRIHEHAYTIALVFVQEMPGHRRGRGHAAEQRAMRHHDRPEQEQRECAARRDEQRVSRGSAARR